MTVATHASCSVCDGAELEHLAARERDQQRAQPHRRGSSECVHCTLGRRLDVPRVVHLCAVHRLDQHSSEAAGARDDGKGQGRIRTREHQAQRRDGLPCKCVAAGTGFDRDVRLRDSVQQHCEQPSHGARLLQATAAGVSALRRRSLRWVAGLRRHRAGVSIRTSLRVATSEAVGELLYRCTERPAPVRHLEAVHRRHQDQLR